MLPQQQITSININLLYLLINITVLSLLVNHMLRCMIKNDYSRWIDCLFMGGSLSIIFLFQNTTIPFVLVLFWGLFALSLMDIFYRVLPNVINFILLILGLVLNVQNQFISITCSIRGILAAYAILWIVSWNYKYLTGCSGIGKGDLKLAAALGAWIGLEGVLPLLFWSSLLGCGFYGFMAVKGEYNRMSRIPFGVFLSVVGMSIFVMRFSLWRL